MKRSNKNKNKNKNTCAVRKVDKCDLPRFCVVYRVFVGQGVKLLCFTKVLLANSDGGRGKIQNQERSDPETVYKRREKQFGRARPGEKKPKPKKASPRPTENRVVLLF